MNLIHRIRDAVALWCSPKSPGFTSAEIEALMKAHYVEHVAQMQAYPDNHDTHLMAHKIASKEPNEPNTLPVPVLSVARS